MSMAVERTHDGDEMRMKKAWVPRRGRTSVGRVRVLENVDISAVSFLPLPHP